MQNIGLLVNQKLYYPGDSYTVPANKTIQVLATPASASWLRIDEANQFIKNIKAECVFPTHNALLSDIGASIHYRLLKEACDEAESEWIVLNPKQSIET